MAHTIQFKDVRNRGLTTTPLCAIITPNAVLDKDESVLDPNRLGVIMANIVKIEESDLEKERQKIQRLKKKQEHIQAQIEVAEENIRVLERYFQKKGVPTQTEEPTTSPNGKYTIERPVEAFRRIAKDDFRGRGFREREIREFANSNGVRTKDGTRISRAYSRTILRDLVDTGFLVKPERGIFRHHEGEAESNGPSTRIRTRFPNTEKNQ